MLSSVAMLLTSSATTRDLIPFNAQELLLLQRLQSLPDMRHDLARRAAPQQDPQPLELRELLPPHVREGLPVDEHDAVVHDVARAELNGHAPHGRRERREDAEEARGGARDVHCAGGEREHDVGEDADVEGLERGRGVQAEGVRDGLWV